MQYCSKCILPDTRPQITINNKNICSACYFFSIKKKKFDFKKVISDIKSKPRTYDCVIPVSGGKDSTWQLSLIKRHGLNPLAVTYKPPLRTKIGQKNLNNLINIGVDVRASFVSNGWLEIDTLADMNIDLNAFFRPI